MQLKRLLEGIIDQQAPTSEILAVENDSRKAGGSSLFVASSSYAGDVHPYIPMAYANGCRHFVIEKKRLEEYSGSCPEARFFTTDNIVAALAKIASRFYGNPSGKMKLVGITGTSGKTTTAFAVHQTLRSMNVPAALVGTIECRILDEVIPATNTTPDILVLNRLMADMVAKGVEVLVMEVSSHSLSLGRVEGLNFDIAAFTNFSQDHLDFHKTMDEYLNAKLSFFALLDRSCKPRKVVLLNRDSDRFDDILQAAKIHPLLDIRICSLKDMKCDYFTTIREMTPEFSVFDLNHTIYRTAMIGITNVYNFSMAAAILSEMGYRPDTFAGKMQDIRVSGRMETIPGDFGFSVVIDYAHKPDALEKLLRTVRGVIRNDGRVLTLFGCGGDRDRGKRPMMGKIAGELSDFVMLTSDNPRTEDPMAIIWEIEKGIKESRNPNYRVEPDRRKAIREVLIQASRGDLVVIAGKGHEDYQIIGKTKNHFSDREEVLSAFAEMKK